MLKESSIERGNICLKMCILARKVEEEERGTYALFMHPAGCFSIQEDSVARALKVNPSSHHVVTGLSGCFTIQKDSVAKALTVNPSNHHVVTGL